MAGASQLIAEAGAVNWFYENTSSDGVLNLSPLGDIGRAFTNFSSGGQLREGEIAAFERGEAYAPVAIVLESAHGFGLDWAMQPSKQSWGLFDLTQGICGLMLRKLMLGRELMIASCCC
jgi:hypothetical protein